MRNKNFTARVVAASVFTAHFVTRTTEVSFVAYFRLVHQQHQQSGGNKRPTGTYTHTHKPALRPLRKSVLWTQRARTVDLKIEIHKNAIMKFRAGGKNEKQALKTQILISRMNSPI